jgi:homoserine O-acetyltransferase/O-succinyltransferase
MEKRFFTHTSPVALETGKTLPSVEIAFNTYGTLNADKSNVIWFCHALTANSDVMDWWASFLTHGQPYDLSKYYLVCANIIGSCYGSSGPLSTNPETGKPYHAAFPEITVRDMVHMHILLRKHLGINKIHTLYGGSLGGYQALEWVIQEPDVFENLVLLSTSAKESAWGIAIHTAQRLAIETDPTWKDATDTAGAVGLKTARAIGLLSYRNYETYVKTQTDDEHKLDNFKASSYIHHQGNKLVKRFNAFSYWILTKALDSHNISRNRASIETVLGNIKTNTLVIGISSDMLCPVTEQKFITAHIPNSEYVEIDSPYGHDGFLIEGRMISEIVKKHHNLL